jgi:hypothetical protein
MDRPSLLILDMYQTKLIPAAGKVDQTLEGNAAVDQRDPERLMPQQEQQEQMKHSGKT